MKLRLLCIGLLIVVVFLASGCVPIAGGVTTGMAPGGAPNSRGAAEPTDTPTPPVSPLPTPTPTATSPVSPLAAPTSVPDAQGNVDQPAVVAPAAEPVLVEYVVRRGDTLARIAANFGVSVKELLAANPTVKSPDRIFVGQRLKIPSRATRPAATPQG